MLQLNEENIYNRYSEIVTHKKKYSNCYLNALECKTKCDNHCFAAYEIKDTFLLLESKQSYYELYFFCDTWEWLDDIADIRNIYDCIVVSIVKRGGLEEYKVFQEKGAVLYKTYRRLRRFGADVSKNKDRMADFCDRNDLNKLCNMMEKAFEPIGDHIPDNDELEQFIEKNSIICCRQNESVVGFIIFEDKGKTSYIRMVCVDENYRGQKIGQRLMEMYFNIHAECKSFTLWYNAVNASANALYTKYGYREEDMNNYIIRL